MVLIVEDGTMPKGANTYASLADADDYLLSRGVSDWPAPPSSDLEPAPQLAAKEAALIRAADYLNGLKWKGEKIEYDWPMAWPRAGVPTGVKNIHGVMQLVACDTVPSAVKRACIELAALFIAGEDPLAPIERGGRVASETVGPISTSYFDDAASETLYPAVSGLVWAFLREIPGQSGSISGFAETGRA